MKEEVINARLKDFYDYKSISFPTSGTTGKSKYVIQQYESILGNAEAFNYASGIDNTVNMYHCLPEEYMGGFLNTVVCPLVAGGTYSVVGAFNPLNFWSSSRALGCNAVWLSPTMAQMLIMLHRDRKGARDEAKHMQHIFCGFAPLGSRTRRAWIDVFGTPLRESYGTSESMLISVQSPEEAMEEENVGQVIPNVTVATRVKDNELMVRIPWSVGYYTLDGGAYACIPTSWGYVHTGDIAHIEDGKITIVGRIKDIIKVGGISVDPRIVEEVLTSADGVMDAAVIGRPHEVMGETLVAFVTGAAQTDLISMCRMHLPNSHVPGEIIFTDSIPRTETGKVLKRELLARVVNVGM